MATLPPSLASSLADRYRIERELGQGGMAWEAAVTSVTAAESRLLPRTCRSTSRDT
ncbi:MAG TPA: hypothetical protein VLB12_08920 [Gemmatimonadales bacterium]|nr:hypothetical protein [Gemmatimonadales bacterium]